MRSPAATLLAVLLLAAPAAANIPAAFYACEGLDELDACRSAGQRGQCVRDTLCDDDRPETPFDECLLCGDGCRGLPLGEVCLLPQSGYGVCVEDPDCAPDSGKSFLCQKCEEGRPPPVEADSGGCHAVDALAAAPWALVLGALLLERRRARSRRSGPRA